MVAVEIQSTSLEIGSASTICIRDLMDYCLPLRVPSLGLSVHRLERKGLYIATSATLLLLSDAGYLDISTFCYMLVSAAPSAKSQTCTNEKRKLSP